MRFFNLNAEIPEILTNQNNWLVWKKGKTDSRGKFSKLPVDPENSKILINYQDSKNLMSFEEARNYYIKNDFISGLGFKLTGNPINNNEYIVGIDIDMLEGRTINDFHNFRAELNHTYKEVSPSSKGIRLFGLSNQLIKNWSHHHIEVYCKNRFLTVTGFEAQGKIKNITKAIQSFSNKYNLKYKKKRKSFGVPTLIPTPNQIANINAYLAEIDADCPGDKYRNIIFSILSLDWGELGIQMAKAWSQTAMHRWSEEYFDDLVSRYDQSRTGENNYPITIATVMHYASVNQDTKVVAWDSIL